MEVEETHPENNQLDDPVFSTERVVKVWNSLPTSIVNFE